MLFNNHTICKVFWWISIIFVMLLSTLVFLLIFKILMVQTINFFTGKTTNERFANMA